MIHDDGGNEGHIGIALCEARRIGGGTTSLFSWFVVSQVLRRRFAKHECFFSRGRYPEGDQEQVKV